MSATNDGVSSSRARASYYSHVLSHFSQEVLYFQNYTSVIILRPDTQCLRRTQILSFGINLLRGGCLDILLPT